MATKEFLAANGETITDEERADALAELEEGNPVLEAPQEVQDMLVDGQLVQAATGRAGGARCGHDRARYTESPASAGALCARHILVATEAEAEAVAAELEAGADFAELAAERSTDPTAADTGGVLAGQDGAECFALTVADERRPGVRRGGLRRRGRRPDRAGPDEPRVARPAGPARTTRSASRSPRCTRPRPAR